MRRASIRLGVVGDRSFFHDGEYWTDAGLGRLIEELRRRCDSLTLALSKSSVRRPLHDHCLSIPRADILELPENPSIARGFWKIPQCLKIIREVERRSDVLVVQLPFSAVLALRSANKPRVYQICHNVRKVVETASAYRGAIRPLAVMAGRYIDWMQHRLIARPNTRFIAHGSELLSLYGNRNGRSIVSSSIMSAEILSVRRSRPLSAPFRVLFVGNLRHEKGIDILVDAVRQASVELSDIEFEIVGARSIVDRGISGELLSGLKSLHDRTTVRFLGSCSFGTELFQCFADADVLVLSSRAEGTPRVLIEARAFGCPVIATNVGGVPDSVTHNVDGLIVPPQDPNALASAIVRIATDPHLRQRLAIAGIERARSTTIEAMATAILSEVESVLES